MGCKQNSSSEERRRNGSNASVLCVFYLPAAFLLASQSIVRVGGCWSWKASLGESLTIGPLGRCLQTIQTMANVNEELGLVEKDRMQCGEH